MVALVSFTQNLTAARSGHNGTIDVPTLLGSAAWKRLPQRVRNRFATSVAAGEQVVYAGVMERVEANFFGKIVAWAGLLAGAPVVTKTGHNVTCDVCLFHDDRRGGTVWQRNYQFAGKKHTAATTKRADVNGMGLECFGRGFGMKLNIFERDGALCFVSRQFYVEVLGWRFVFPKILQPGCMEVVHRDLDGGKFRFSMTLRHRVFGMMLYQDGVFEDPVAEIVERERC